MRVIRPVHNIILHVAVTFTSSHATEAPNFWKVVAESIINEIKGKLGGIFGGGGGGGGLGGFVGSVGGALGFAKGGQIVKGGIDGVDSVPILAQQGELVVDRSLTRRLDDFVANNESGNSALTNTLLNQILSTLSQNQVVESEVSLNGDAFANIILNLNRRNARLGA